MKIQSFEIENVKRVRTVSYEPTQNGITVIGGKNCQGKTSILDAIAWALGGNKYAPDSPQRDGSAATPYIKLTLDNGLVVERKGKNSELYVTDPTGQRYGQKLLDSFVSQLALDLPRFLNANDREKADVLLQIIGIGDQLAAADKAIKLKYSQRQAYFPMMDAKMKHAQEMPEYPDAPDHIVSSMELIKRNSEILARNGENQKKRENLDKMLAHRIETEQHIKFLMDKVQMAQNELTSALKAQAQLDNDIEIAQKTVEELQDESTDEIQAQLHDIDAINAKVRANMDKEAVKEEAEQMRQTYEQMSVELDELRKQRRELLNGANLPLPNLGIDDGCLTYNGKKWKDMSGSDQLIVATSIVKCLNPNCNFVLMDKLEQMDLDTLNAFGAWLQDQGLQVIATRVSTGDECQIIIEDGLIKDPEPFQLQPQYAAPMKDWRTMK